MNSAQIILKPGREKALERRHPWLFSGAVAELKGDPAPGATVDILANDQSFVAQAAYSPQSQIRARVWTWQPEPSVDTAFLRQRLEAAIRARAPYRTRSNALRLVHAESDGLPGLIVDQYADTLVAQFLSAGAEFWKQEIADALLLISDAQKLYERSDAEVRKLEGLQSQDGWLRHPDPEAPGGAEPLTIEEHGLNFIVDVAEGHKTGFYLDQRANRQRVRALAEDADVLDCFAYTGSMAANALYGGAASVTLVDDSADALAVARRNLELNELDPGLAEFIDGDVFKELRTMRDSRKSYDLIVLDPPKFAPTRAQAEQAARGYKDINLLAFKLLRPGGRLVTLSCSGGVDADLFQKIVAGAALDAEVDARILERLTQAPDHAVALNFPEGEYLKGLVCQVG